MLLRNHAFFLALAICLSACATKALCPERKAQNQIVLNKLQEALNSRNADTLSAVVADSYKSIQPLNPERNFTGRQGVRDNWSRAYAMLPDFRAELLSAEVGCQAVYSEWKWSGQMNGDSLFYHARSHDLYPSDGQIDSARLYFDTAPR